MADDVFGHAFIEIRPDTSGFRRELDRKLDTAVRRYKLDVAVSPKGTIEFCAELKKKLARCSVRVDTTPITTGFCTKLKEKLSNCSVRVNAVPTSVGFCTELREKLSKCSPRISVTPNTTGFCSELRTRLAKCNATINVKATNIGSNDISRRVEYTRRLTAVQQSASVSTDHFSSSVSNLQSSSDRASGHMSRLRGVLATVGVALGIATATATAFGAALGIKTAAQLEQAEISFTTLLHSSDLAKKHLEDLKKFAAATPFELQGLIEADRALIGAGESFRKTLPTLTAWGDASGALGQTQEQFSRTMLAVTQSMGKGKIQAEELMQITEAGIPIWSLLSRALHKPIPELQDMSSKGKLLASDVLPKLEVQMEKDYGGAMIKQSQTLNGLWSTFKETLSQGLANAILPLEPHLRDALPGAINILSGSLEKLSGAIASTIGWFERNSQEGGLLKTTWDTISYATRAFADFWNTKIAPLLQAASNIWMPILRRAMNDVRASLENLRNSGVRWDTLLKTLGVTLGLIAIIIGTVVVGALLLLSGALRTTTALVRPLWLAFLTVTNIIIAALSTLLHAAVISFGWIPGLGPKLRAAEREFNVFAARVNAALGRIRPRETAVNVRTMINGKPVSVIQRPGGTVSITSGGHTVTASAAGGYISGPGGPTDDRIPALLSNGEYVVRTKAVRKIGVRNLDKINAFADGGLVGTPSFGSTDFSSVGTLVQQIASSLGTAIASQLRKASDTFGVGNLGVPANVSGNAALGRIMAATLYGWTGANWAALYKLWTGESGWNHRARNPSSGAYGIPQSLPASKMASAGSDYLTNPATQIRWGLGYIAGRYGSPLGALSAWNRRSPHWYDTGGILPPGLTLAYNGTGRNERVVMGGDEKATVINNYNFPNYIGDKRDLVKAIDDLRRQRRI